MNIQTVKKRIFNLLNNICVLQKLGAKASCNFATAQKRRFFLPASLQQPKNSVFYFLQTCSSVKTAFLDANQEIICYHFGSTINFFGLSMKEFEGSKQCKT
jgi:hypothetical protein